MLPRKSGRCSRNVVCSKLVLAVALFVVAYILIFPVGQANAADTPTWPVEPPDSLLTTYSHAVVFEQYPASREIENRVLDGPEEWRAWGYLMRATRILSEQMDFGDTVGSAVYQTSLDSAVRLFTSALDQHPDAPSKIQASWHAALGTLYTLQSQRAFDIEQSAIASIRFAGKGFEENSLALDLDPDRLETKANALLYEFWRSRALSFLAWTPFVDDRREEALKGLWAIARSGGVASEVAIRGFAWALIEANRNHEAAALADSVLAVRGNVRGLLEPAGKALFLEQRWDEAADRYYRLVESVRQAPRRNETREVGALHRLGHIEAARGNWADVVRIVNEAESVPLDAEQKKRKKDDLRRLARLREQAREALDEQ